MIRFIFAVFLLAACERAEKEELIEGVIVDYSGTDLTQDNPDLVVTVSEDYSWADGYCSLVLVTNYGNEELDWDVLISVEGSVSSYWNAEMEDAADEKVQFYGTDSNYLLPPSAIVEFGFCAQR